MKKTELESLQRKNPTINYVLKTKPFHNIEDIDIVPLGLPISAPELTSFCYFSSLVCPSSQ